MTFDDVVQLARHDDNVQALFHDLEPLARARGHVGVIDDWGPDVALLRGA